MNLKYNWILKETFYFFEILTRNIPEKKNTKTYHHKQQENNNKQQKKHAK